MTNLTLDQTDASSDQLASKTAPSHAIRILRSGVEERTVTLAQGKCTIGSSQRCQIHLASADVRPLHCLIVHRSTETVATRWAPGVLLNGHEFKSAPLQLGDTISIGDVELQLVSSSSEVKEEKTVPPTSVGKETLETHAVESSSFLVSTELSLPEIGSKGQLLNQKSSNSTTSESTEPKSEHYKESSRVARIRSRNMVAAIRALRSQIADFENQIDQYKNQQLQILQERDQYASDLQNLQTEISEKSFQSVEETDRLIAELTEAFENLEQAEAKSAEYAAQLEKLSAELANAYQEREQLTQQHNDISSERDQLLADLSALQSEIASSNQQSSEETDQLISELTEAFDKAEAAEASKAEREAELEALREDLFSVQENLKQLQESHNQGEQQRAKLTQVVADRERSLEALQESYSSLQADRNESDQKLAAAMERADQLQSAVDQLVAERDELISTRSSYQLRDQEWEQVLAEKEQRLALLENERDQLAREIEVEQQRFVEAISLDEVHQEEFVKLQEEFEQLQVKQSDLETNRQQLETALAEQESKLAAKTAECEQYAEVLDKFQKEAFEETDARKRLEEELLQARNECELLRGVDGEHQHSLQELHVKLTQSQEQLNSLQAEYEAAKEAYKNLEFEAARNESECQTVESELDSIRSRCDAVVEEQKTAEKQLQALNGTLAERDRDVEQLNEQLVQSAQKCQELEDSLVELQSSKEHLTHQLSQLKEEYQLVETQKTEEFELRQQLQQQLAEGKQSSELYEVDLQSLRAELNTSTQRVTNLEAELSVAGQKISELQNEIQAAAVSESQVQDSANAEEIAHLAQEKAALIESCNQQQEQIERLSQEHAQLEAQYQQALEKLSHATESLKVAEEALLNHEEPIAAEPESSELELSANPQEILNESLIRGEESELQEDSTASEIGNAGQDFFAAPAEEEEPKEDFKPTSFIEQYSDMLEDSNGGFTQQPEPVSAPVNKLAEAEFDNSDESDDAALEAYMANMMNRMRGGASEEVATPLHNTENSQINQNPDPVAAVDEMVQRVAAPTTVERELNSKPIDLESLKSSSRKPVLQADLNAMRELANTSARKAIAKHHRRRHVEMAVGSFLVCLIAMGVGIFLMLSNSEVLSPQFVGGAIATVIGVIGGAKLIGQLWSAFTANARPALVQPEEISIEDHPLPIDGPVHQGE